MKNKKQLEDYKKELKVQEKLYKEQKKENKIKLKKEREIENAQNRGLVNRIKLFGRRIWNRFSKSRIGIRVNALILWLMRRIEQSIRFELMVVFGICFVLAFMFYGVANNVLSRDHQNSRIEYDYEYIQNNALNLVKELSNSKEKTGYYDETGKFYNSEDEYYQNIDVNNRGNNHIGYKESLADIFARNNNSRAKIYLTDLDGKVIYKSNSTGEEKLDIYAIIDKSNNIAWDGDERTLLYPVKIGDARNYLVYSETPTPQLRTETYYKENSFFALILSVLVFIVSFIVITNRKIKYLDDI
ncbi:MAG: hypothetical protein ACRC68_02895, partial [Clostridium sp.]